jgi:sugar phosphate permease
MDSVYVTMLVFLTVSYGTVFVRGQLCNIQGECLGAIVGFSFEVRSVMGGLVISCADCRAINARRRTTAHVTVINTVLCTDYVVNKTDSCVLMNVILVTMI